jgi:hypothetical protein
LDQSRCTVLLFLSRIDLSRKLFGCMILCGVTSAVTEIMVRVLHSRMGLGCTIVRVEPLPCV